MGDECEHNNDLIHRHEDLFQKLFDKLDGINKKLFQDNGAKSVQTRLIQTENAIINFQKSIDEIKNDIKTSITGKKDYALVKIILAGLPTIVICVVWLFSMVHVTVDKPTKEDVQVLTQVHSPKIIDPNN